MGGEIDLTPSPKPIVSPRLLDISTAGRDAVVEELTRARPKPKRPMRELQEHAARAASLTLGPAGGLDGLLGSPAGPRDAPGTFVTKDGSCLPRTVQTWLQPGLLSGAGGGGGDGGGGAAAEARVTQQWRMAAARASDRPVQVRAAGWGASPAVPFADTRRNPHGQHACKEGTVSGRQCSTHSYAPS
jgi:hypothetical protein